MISRPPPRVETGGGLKGRGPHQKKDSSPGPMKSCFILRLNITWQRPTLKGVINLSLIYFCQCWTISNFMGALDRAQRALSNAPPLSRDHRKPSHCVACEGLRSWLRRTVVIPGEIAPLRPLQPPAYSSSCIPVPRGCTGAALARLVQVVGVY